MAQGRPTRTLEQIKEDLIRYAVDYCRARRLRYDGNQEDGDEIDRQRAEIRKTRLNSMRRFLAAVDGFLAATGGEPIKRRPKVQKDRKTQLTNEERVLADTLLSAPPAELVAALDACGGCKHEFHGDRICVHGMDMNSATPIPVCCCAGEDKPTLTLKKAAAKIKREKKAAAKFDADIPF